MATMQVKNASGISEAIEKPLPPARAAASASRPVVLSTEDLAAINALAAAIAALGNSASLTFPAGLNALNGSSVIDWTGGPGLLSLYGNFNGATVQASYSPDGGTTYIDTEGGSLSANATLRVDYPDGKVKLTATGTPTSVAAKLQSTR